MWLLFRMVPASPQAYEPFLPRRRLTRQALPPEYASPYYDRCLPHPHRFCTETFSVTACSVRLRRHICYRSGLCFHSAPYQLLFKLSLELKPALSQNCLAKPGFGLDVAPGSFQYLQCRSRYVLGFQMYFSLGFNLVATLSSLGPKTLLHAKIARNWPEAPGMLLQAC